MFSDPRRAAPREATRLAGGARWVAVWPDAVERALHLGREGADGALVLGDALLEPIIERFSAELFDSLIDEGGQLFIGEVAVLGLELGIEAAVFELVEFLIGEVGVVEVFPGIVF